MLTYEKQKDSDRFAIEKWASRGYLRMKKSLDHAQLLGHHMKEYQYWKKEEVITSLKTKQIQMAMSHANGSPEWF